MIIDVYFIEITNNLLFLIFFFFPYKIDIASSPWVMTRDLIFLIFII